MSAPHYNISTNLNKSIDLDVTGGAPIYQSLDVCHPPGAAHPVYYLAITTFPDQASGYQSNYKQRSFKISAWPWNRIPTGNACW